jgi:hypothetical protein
VNVIVTPRASSPYPFQIATDVAAMCLPSFSFL